MPAMPKVLSFEGRRITIHEGDVIPIGRASNKSKIFSNPENLSFDNAVLSRDHAIVYMQDGDVFVKDESSTHGSIYYSPDGTRHDLKTGVPQLLSDKGTLELGADVLRGTDVHKKISGTVRLATSPATPPAKENLDVVAMESRDNVSESEYSDQDDSLTIMTFETRDRKSDDEPVVSSHNDESTSSTAGHRTLASQTLSGGLISSGKGQEQAELRAELKQEAAEAKARLLAEKRKEIMAIMVSRRLAKAKAEAEQRETLAALEATSPHPEDAHLTTTDAQLSDRSEGIIEWMNSKSEPAQDLTSSQAPNAHSSSVTVPVPGNSNEHLIVDLDTGKTYKKLSLPWWHRDFTGPVDPLNWLKEHSGPVDRETDSQATREASPSTDSEAPSEYATHEIANEAEDETYYPGPLASLNEAVEGSNGRGDHEEHYPQTRAEQSSHELWDSQSLLRDSAYVNRNTGWQGWDDFADASDDDSGIEPEEIIDLRELAQASLNNELAGAPLTMDSHGGRASAADIFVPDTLQRSSEERHVKTDKTGNTLAACAIPPQSASLFETSAARKNAKRPASDALDSNSTPECKRVKTDHSITWSSSVKRTALGMLLGIGLTFGGLAALGASG